MHKNSVKFGRLVFEICEQTDFATVRRNDASDVPNFQDDMRTLRGIRADIFKMAGRPQRPPV